MVRFVLLLLIVSVFCASADYDYEPIQEIHYTACKIATKEIEASANATITRQLKGVCTSKELNNKLKQLESKLLEELKAMKDHFIGKAKQNNQLEDRNQFGHKSLESNDVAANNRYDEIAKFNQTTHNLGSHTEFYYYWNIDNAASELNAHNSINSGNFYSHDRLFYMTLTPHHLGTKYACLELKTVGMVSRKHKFVILNQESSKYDISSQILGNFMSYTSLYRLSQDKLLTFIKNNTLFVKLILIV